MIFVIRNMYYLDKPHFANHFFLAGDLYLYMNFVQVT